MIGIRECNANTESIKVEHTNYVSNHISSIIDFYIGIIQVFKEIRENSPKDEESLIESILILKKNFNVGNYKALILNLLVNNTELKRKEQLPIINNMDTWKNELVDLDNIFAELNYLKNNYASLLAMNFLTNLDEFTADYNHHINNTRRLKFLLCSIFDYDNWFSKLPISESWGPYKLTERLALKSCPYCNRQYTHTISEEIRKIARPELDHFLPKDKNPLLSLSFYNLIPSCSTCNGAGIKASKPISFANYLNPYEPNSKHSLLKFSYLPKTYESAIGKSEDVVVLVKENVKNRDKTLIKKVNGNIQLFCLNELYQSHADIVCEIIRKRHISGDQYLKILQETYNSFSISPDEAYRLAYGNYFQESEFSKRPLSKLTKDIAIELGSIVEYQENNP